MSKEKREDLDFSDAEVVFTNIVNLNFNGEDVILTLGVKERKNSDGKVKASHQVVFSLPHFIRTLQMLNSFRDHLEEKGVISMKKDKNVR